MYQIILHLKGMHNHTCECNINNTLRNFFDTKKVISHAELGTTTILCAHKIPESDLHDVLDPTGYRVLSYKCQTYHPKHLWDPLLHPHHKPGHSHKHHDHHHPHIHDHVMSLLSPSKKKKHKSSVHKKSLDSVS